ncbi:uncharacterized protein TRAVEDRAFT_67328 [Trametes versicolor FP-101664 SS1]|uniref:uncharacterized protein n=1 Tax=Trametes versicolor (strain FP-101664) TaxID=717944 RepID=UPI0004624774|nr:uncharacterized protein TRAVEDRAFT_67328 [Trametes versicolor FP-101664 SS1]EIW53018.1 hypothetical protein TRAVEDRAFT_67328 [Trametes versicolor FP-101664 SS1]
MTDLLELTTPYFPEFSDLPSTDEPSNLASLLAGVFSALLGGAHAMLQEDEEWPHCKMCGRPLVPYLQINATTAHTPAEFRAHLDCPPSRTDAATLFQVFICTGPGRNGSCLEDWTSGAHPGVAMRARLVHCGSQTAVRPIETPEALAGARGVLPQRVISEWTPGNPEVPHFEMLDMMDGGEYDEDFYDAHEPAGGLKLLGNAVLGKVQNFPDTNGRPPHGEAEGYLCYRSLVQLGTDDGDMSDYTFVTVGNVFVLQCKTHPDNFQPGRSFSW